VEVDVGIPKRPTSHRITANTNGCNWSDDRENLEQLFSILWLDSRQEETRLKT
jgi:hypothetical protein